MTERSTSRVLANRSAGIDALRVASIAAVIFGHVYTGPLTHQWIYAWHVPLFFILAGYFWKSGRVWVSEVRNRFRTLMVPYIGWFLVVSTMFLSINSFTGPVSLNSLLPSLRGGSHAQGPFGTLWFVSVLFFTVVLYRGMERLPRVVQTLLAFCGLCLAYIYGEFLAGMPLGIGLAIPCLAFVLAGRLLQFVEPYFSHPLLIGALLLALAGLAVAFVPQEFIDLKNGLFGTPGIGLAVAVSAGSGMILIARRIPLGTHVAKLSVALGAVGIAVVLAHPIVIWAFRTHEVMPKWTLLAAVILPWIVAMLLRLTPISALLVGMRHFPLETASMTTSGEKPR